MTKPNTRSPLAMTAIAAVLAISATPALAQSLAEQAPAPAPTAVEAPPPIILQPAAPAASTRAPAIVSQPMVQTVPAAPVAVAEPEPSTSAAAPATRATNTRRVTATRTAATAAAATVGAPSAPVVAEPVLAPLPASVAATGPVVAPVATAEPVDEPAGPMPSDALMLGGLLAALGLGGAYALSRRRRRADDEAVEFERPVVTPIVPVAPSAAAPVAFKPLVTAPRTRAIAQQIAGERLTAPLVAHPVAERRIERFAMPTGPVPRDEERDALLDEMVAAPADSANPFTTRKARRRRARIILQTREAELQQDARQPFDWRQHDARTDGPTTETTPARDPALV